MIIKLLVDAGDMKPSPAIGQKLGPLGINIGKVIQDVNKATSSFKGMKVPVSLDIDSKTKNFNVKVNTPATAELLKKELALEKASSAPNKIKIGNIAIEQVIAIAEVKQQDMLVNSFEEAVKSVLGSCVSLGILVEDKNPKDMIAEINSGNYKEEISSQKTEISEEKRAKLDEFFSKIKAKQDEIIKAEKAAAEAAQAATPEAKTEEAKTEEKQAPEKKEAKKGK